MKAGRYNITVEKGANFILQLTWKDQNESIINLTGYTARMHMREELADISTVLILTTENGRITLGGVLGTITLQISNIDTSAISACSGVYDLELISSAGVVTRLLEGDVLFSNEVTR